MNAETIRAALQCDRPGCSCHRARGPVHCPAHDDAHPSLSVDETDDGRVLVHCFAGCKQPVVIEALRVRGLWDGRTPAPRLSQLVHRGGETVLMGPINEVARFIERYIKMRSDHATTAAALWVAHAWVFQAFDITPYLLVKSAMKRSGKSQLLKVLALLLPNPWLVFSPSEAVLFRKIARDCPQVLLDESDPLFNGRIEQHEPLRALLNAGYERGAVVPRCVGEGSKMQLVDFEVFCPKAIAAIGNLPDTIEDRSIIIPMKRATPAEQRGLGRFRRRQAREDAAPIREALTSWAAAALPKLRDARPAIPDELDARAADIWEPLLAVAEEAGDGWAVTAWAAALALSAGEAREDDGLRARLLADIRRVFEDHQADRFATAALIDALCEDNAAPWGDYKNGRRITPQALAGLLRPLGILPDKWREGSETVRGYTLDAFRDAFSRYLSCEPPQPPHANQDGNSSGFEEPPQTPVVATTENGANADGERVVASVAVDTLRGGDGEPGITTPEDLEKGAGLGQALLRIGETLTWARAPYAPDRAITPGKPAWLTFIRRNSVEELQRAWEGFDA